MRFQNVPLFFNFHIVANMPLDSKMCCYLSYIAAQNVPLDSEMSSSIPKCAIIVDISQNLQLDSKMCHDSKIDICL